MKRLLLITLLLMLGFVNLFAQATHFDLVVYGATEAGVMAAVAASRENLKVALVEPTAHIGGMLTGGLSGSDIANPDVIGGLAREFFDRMGSHYNAERLGHSTAWNFEPHVAEAALKDLLNKANVSVFLNEPLSPKQDRVRIGSHILGFQTRTRRWDADAFADCTYEGDLLPLIGVAFTSGRESSSKYRESLAGVRAETPANQLPNGVSSYRSGTRTLLPEVNPGPLARPGSGDDKVQAFNFRLIMSRDTHNQISFEQPNGYNPATYALLNGVWKALQQSLGRPLVLSDIFRIVPIPNDKADFNNIGGFSTDFLNHSWTYLNATAEGRKAIFDDHVRYTKGLLFFLSHDDSVPIAIREELCKWGLAKDEFTESNNWPPQLYIREGRRMVGEFVLTQADLLSDRVKGDSIGMGSHNIDSHNVQRIVDEQGMAKNEGDVQEHVQPYALPYRILTPLHSEADNLLVPICVSASHVAYSSLRMEPQYMILGQAAGVAAALAVHDHRAVQDIDIHQLQDRLVALGAILSYPIATNYIVQ
ncbi:MAG: putative secreted protein putative xanthan lyase related [Acidobacteriaceae bacterium]|nr:putative secreted protein putative xanthan lyase related [Acidobacteriaceae bacterium]